jgi:hypothetical protein
MILTLAVGCPFIVVHETIVTSFEGELPPLACAVDAVDILWWPPPLPPGLELPDAINAANPTAIITPIPMVRAFIALPRVK